MPGFNSMEYCFGSQQASVYAGNVALEGRTGGQKIAALRFFYVKRLISPVMRRIFRFRIGKDSGSR